MGAFIGWAIILLGIFFAGRGFYFPIWGIMHKMKKINVWPTIIYISLGLVLFFIGAYITQL